MSELYNGMTREAMVDALIAWDRERIYEDTGADDFAYDFLYSILSGDGWVPYNQLTDAQVVEEYNERLGCWPEHFADGGID